MSNEDKVINRLVSMSTLKRNYWVLLPPVILALLLLYALYSLVSGVSHDIDNLADAVRRNNKAETACVDSGGDPVMADIGLKYIGCRKYNPKGDQPK